MKEYLRHIRVRLTLWYVLLMFLVLVIVGSALYFTLQASLLREVDASLRNTSSQVIANMDTEDNTLSVQNSEESTNILTELAVQGYAIRLLDSQGIMTQEAGPSEAVFRNVGFYERGFRTLDVSGEAWRVFSLEVRVPGSDTAIIMQVAQSLAKVTSTLSKVLFMELISIPLVLLLALAIGIFMSARALRPIEKITQLAESTEAVDLSRRLALDLPDDEIGRLANTLNSMLDRLEEAFSGQKRFVSEAAHELRTPLTIMKGTTEVALGRERSQEEYKEVLEELKIEIDHLSFLAEDLLALSQADSERSVLTMQEIDLFEVMQSAIDMIVPLAREKKIALDLEASGPVLMRGDANKLTRMFLNMLDNAVKYSPRQSRVTVSLRANEKEIAAEISDKGPGINREDIDLIFDRFHRSEYARDQHPGGSGLGLPIARWIARAHGGDIAVESDSGKGTSFLIRFPVNRGE
jgi:heavy metal sensor kinase